jgi:hypothetical protein
MLLVSLAARPMPTHLNDQPEGHYDHHQQKWILPDDLGLPTEWVMSSRTGDPTTYSATTRIGADNDQDDKGT